MARPRKQIDQGVVERLANRQASDRMIAAVVGCSARTLKRRFGRHLPLWRECGKTKIINAQWDAMERGNIVAAIFLGKQYLGQADKQEVTATVIEAPANPLAAYTNDPNLLDRALKLEEDFTNAISTDAPTLPFVSGANRHSGLGLSAPPPAPPAGGNGTPHKRDGEPPGD